MKEFDPDDPRDAAAFARGVMAASADTRDKLEMVRHHTAAAYEARRAAVWLLIGASLLIGFAFQPGGDWWVNIAFLILGVGVIVIAARKVREYARHTTAATIYNEVRHPL